jgi:hypothetical protein
MFFNETLVFFLWILWGLVGGYDERIRGNKKGSPSLRSPHFVICLSTDNISEISLR